MKNYSAAVILLLLVLSGCSGAVQTIGVSQLPSSSSSPSGISSQAPSQPQNYPIGYSSAASKASSSASQPPAGSSSKPIPSGAGSSSGKPAASGYYSITPSNPPASSQIIACDEFASKLKKLVYDGVAAGPQQKKYIYNVNKSWESVVYNYSYDTPGQAHLSWKVSWTLEGLDYAYRATNDRYFLNESIAIYDALLDVRDDKIGRPAWNGTVYPLWGSTARYNGSRFVLTDENGTALAELIFNCVGNDETYVMVNKNDDQGCFDLNIKYGKTEYALKSLTLDTLADRINSEISWTYYGSPLADKKVVQARLLTENLDLLPVSQQYLMAENTNVPTVVHTAMILEPMVNTYIEMKKISHPKAQQYKNEIYVMIDCLISNMRDKNGFFKDFENSPAHLGGGKILPWNQQFPLVAAMANFAAAENDSEYKKYVGEFCDYFLSNVSKTPTGYLWKYWNEPSGNAVYNETTNYSGIDINSIYSIYKTGLGFGKNDIEQIAATIDKRILQIPSKPASYIDGSSPKAENTKLLYKLLAIPQVRSKIIAINKNQEMEWQDAARMLYYYNLK